ncbi:MAG: proline dehydrogenase [Bacteroidetes bacterium]|nr:MAG: proline dehydrogenase [Bacteroidota bacterium]
MKELSVKSFDNTELAFASKTDWQLKKAYYLFKIVNNNTMASVATFSATLGLNLHLPIKGIIKKTVFEHFCGGETILECEETSEKMAKYNVGSILDYSVEGKDSEEAFDKALSETLKTLENAKGNLSVPYCVFKPTGLGSSILMEKVQLGEELSDSEKEAFERVKKRYDTLSKAAYDNDVRLLIDAEDSWYQDTIDDLLYDLMEKYNKERAIVFNTYQMYRWESLENIKKAHQMANEKGFVLGAKLVRGAYMEVERERAEEKGYNDPICVDKEATDKSYDDGLKYCVENIDNIELFNGTHNEQSNFYLADLMARAGLERNDSRIFFVQLFGMSDNISFVLADAGYNVAKYLPYGPIKHVMPYLIRRASENTSVGGQSSRELVMLSQEMRRRKNNK